MMSAWAYGLALDDILLANYDTAYSSKDYYVGLQSSRGCFYSSDTVSLITVTIHQLHLLMELQYLLLVLMTLIL